MIDNLRLIELFAGYGSQALALKYLGIPFEHHFVCEFDKYAIQSYNDIHRTNFEVSNIKDISADDLNIVDTDKYKYLMTYSFPCTDLSLAGKRKGMQRGSGTSSSLLWEVERLLKECKELPQYLLMENVPQVISNDNIKLFGEWTSFLIKLGYKNQYKLLNAKDFGVPQNRERCFMVSILKSENKDFAFPKPRPLEIRLKDVLESYEKVDEKYYLTSEKAQRLIYQLFERGDLPSAKTISVSDLANHYVKKLEISHTLCARDYKGFGNHEGNAVVERVENREPLIVSSRGRNPNNPSDRSTNNLEQRLEVQQDGISNTLTTFQKDNYVLEQNPISTKGKKLDVAKTILAGYERANMTGFNEDNAVFSNYQIRKLTPKECFRLMGVKDEDYDKLTVSNTQRYKQAGNSIVVDVLMAIFENMFIKDCKSNKLF